MADKIICTNISTYDFTKYDAVGMVSSLSVHAVSVFRDIVSGISGLVGGRNKAMEKKYADIRAEAMKELRQKAYEHNAVMLVGIDFDISTSEEKFVICMATGTILINKQQKGKGLGDMLNAAKDTANMLTKGIDTAKDIMHAGSCNNKTQKCRRSSMRK